MRIERLGAHTNFEEFEVSADDRLQERIENGRAGSLILADFGTYDRGQRDVESGQRLANAITEQPLMIGVRIGVKQGDGDGFDVEGGKLRDDCIDVGVSRNALRAAVETHALPESETPIAGNQCGDRLRMYGVNLAAIVPADLQHVLKSRRRYQRAGGQLAFEHGVGGNRGAVHEVADVRQPEAVTLTSGLDAVKQRNRWVFRGCRQLMGNNPAVARVEDLQIGERSPDIDANPYRFDRGIHLSGPNFPFSNKAGIACVVAPGGMDRLRPGAKHPTRQEFPAICVP